MRNASKLCPFVYQQGQNGASSHDYSASFFWFYLTKEIDYKPQATIIT
jgi:hypothetical protein